MKKIRRRVLIREYDYQKIINHAAGGIMCDGMILYNRSEFHPVSQKSIEQEVMWANLTSSSRQNWLYRNHPNQLLDGMHDYLYDSRYRHWKKFWDKDNYLCLQARLNTPVSRLGWGIFEYDPELQ